MLSDETLSRVTAIQRKIYTALTEIGELTDELSSAVNRQDQVSVQMFLSLRQQEIDRAMQYKAEQQKLYAQLPAAESALLRNILDGKSGCGTGTAACTALEQQVQRNYTLLERVRRADRAISCRVGGSNSFYEQK